MGMKKGTGIAGGRATLFNLFSVSKEQVGREVAVSVWSGGVESCPYDVEGRQGECCLRSEKNIEGVGGEGSNGGRSTSVGAETQGHGFSCGANISRSALEGRGPMVDHRAMVDTDGTTSSPPGVERRHSMALS